MNYNPTDKTPYGQINGEFFITKHAYERMKERFNCAEEKIKKIVMKAWFSKEPVAKELIIIKEQHNLLVEGYKNSVYRLFQGHLFVFVSSQPNKNSFFTIKRLITVYKKPSIRNLKRIPQFSSGHFNASTPKRKENLKVGK